VALRFEQTVFVGAPVEKVWALLIDPVQVAACVPGAAIEEKVDDRTWRGSIKVKVGPVTTKYRGTMRFERLDADRREVELVGRGQDVKGRGGAEMRMRSRLQPSGAGTEVWIATEVSITGLLAQLGRGMVEGVSVQIFRQFAAAVQRKVAGVATGESPPRSLDALALGAKAVGHAVKRFLGTGTDGA